MPCRNLNAKGEILWVLLSVSPFSMCFGVSAQEMRSFWAFQVSTLSLPMAHVARESKDLEDETDEIAIRKQHSRSLNGFFYSMCGFKVILCSFVLNI